MTHTERIEYLTKKSEKFMNGDWNRKKSILFETIANASLWSIKANRAKTARARKEANKLAESIITRAEKMLTEMEKQF